MALSQALPRLREYRPRLSLPGENSRHCQYAVLTPHNSITATGQTFVDVYRPIGLATRVDVNVIIYAQPLRQTDVTIESPPRQVNGVQVLARRHGIVIT